jgi:hypothetical protein
MADLMGCKTVRLKKRGCPDGWRKNRHSAQNPPSWHGVAARGEQAAQACAKARFQQLSCATGAAIIIADIYSIFKVAQN